MRRISKLIASIMLVFAGLIWIPFWLVMSGTVCIQWHGFGVDQFGNVYVGKEENIDIYNDGNRVGTIDIPRFRSYRMAVESNVIIIATSQYVYKYDSNGNELSCIEDINGYIHSQIGNSMKLVHTADGVTYMAQTFWRHKIIREDGIVVYQMPLFDFVVKLNYIVSIISFVVLGIMDIARRKYTVKYNT